jgi:hypothetical protein
MPTVFAIVFPGIKSRPHGSFKDFPNIREINAMFANVLFVLFFVPLKSHGRSLTVRRILIQDVLISGSYLTFELSRPHTSIRHSPQGSAMRGTLSRGRLQAVVRGIRTVFPELLSQPSHACAGHMSIFTYTLMKTCRHLVLIGLINRYTYQPPARSAA